MTSAFLVRRWRVAIGLVSFAFVVGLYGSAYSERQELLELRAALALGPKLGFGFCGTRSAMEPPRHYGWPRPEGVLDKDKDIFAAMSQAYAAKFKK